MGKLDKEQVSEGNEESKLAHRKKNTVVLMQAWVCELIPGFFRN